MANPLLILILLILSLGFPLAADALDGGPQPAAPRPPLSEAWAPVDQQMHRSLVAGAAAPVPFVPFAWPLACATGATCAAGAASAPAPSS